MFLKWIKKLWKKLTGGKEKTQTNTDKNSKISDGSSLNQISVSDRGSSNNINSSGRSILITISIIPEEM